MQVYLESDIASRLAACLNEICDLSFIKTGRFVQAVLERSQQPALLQSLESTFPSRYITRVFFITDRCHDLSFLSGIDTTEPLRVQASPVELQNEILDVLDERALLSPTKFANVLYVIHLNGEYLYGMFHSESLFKNRRVRSDRLSRAYYKIDEALTRFSIVLTPDLKVLDIGAAPGGWSQYLCEHGARVVAVDPGELHIQHENLIHIRDRLENCATELERYAPFDMMLCDMNMDPRISADLLCKVSPLITDTASLIMTIKLIYKSRRRNETLIEETIERLSCGYEIIGVKWLLANSRYERCVYGRKKPCC